MLDFVIHALRPYGFPGKARLLDRLVSNKGRRTARVFGYRVELELGEFIQRMIYLGAYERKETALVRDYLRPGMTFVDVGANVGYYTLLAASRVGVTGRVFAVEPSPYAADKLERAVQENYLSSVQVSRLGLSNQTGEALLFAPLPDNHTPTMLGEPGSQAIVVPVKRLDECLTEWGVGSIDLLKVDVEGYEPRVFEGAVEALSGSRIRAILCEFNDYWLRRAGSSSQELYGMLLGMGYADATGHPAFLSDHVVTRFLVRSISN